jgi:hypothetical protein
MSCHEEINMHTTTQIDVKPNRHPGGLYDFWMEDIMQDAILGPEQEADLEQQHSLDRVSGQCQIGIND